MTDAPNLLPCPFCGGEAALERYGTRRQSCIVSCQNCGCRLESGETHNSGNQWNTRTDQHLALVDRLLREARNEARREAAAIAENYISTLASYGEFSAGEEAAAGAIERDILATMEDTNDD